MLRYMTYMTDTLSFYVFAYASKYKLQRGRGDYALCVCFILCIHTTAKMLAILLEFKNVQLMYKHT